MKSNVYFLLLKWNYALTVVYIYSEVPLRGDKSYTNIYIWNEVHAQQTTHIYH